MKKVLKIGIVIILIVIAGAFIYNLASKNSRKYEVLEITEFDYFILKQNSLYKDEKNTALFAPVVKVENESRSLMTKKECLKQHFFEETKMFKTTLMIQM